MESQGTGAPNGQRDDNGSRSFGQRVDKVNETAQQAWERTRDAFSDLVTLAADAVQNGGRMYYGYPVGESLLRDPLSPLLKASGADYERFKASRSMRDVEHVSSVEILDPFGNALT